MRRKFDKEFKSEAVKLTEDRPLTHVAKDLGLQPNVLSKWKQQLKKNPLNAFTGKGTPEEEEIKKLKKELAQVTQQRDILKKAIAIFSEQPQR
jgi:transposase